MARKIMVPCLMKSTICCRTAQLIMFLVIFPLTAIADMDYYSDFLMFAGYYSKCEQRGAEGNAHPPKMLNVDMKHSEEVNWRNRSAQGDIQSVPNGNGGAIVAWNEGGSRVYLQSIARNGNRLWGPIPINKMISRHDAYQLVSDGNGGVFVAWQEVRYGCGDQNISYVMAQRFDSESRTLWGPRGITVSSGGRDSAPQIVADSKGGAIVIWPQVLDGSGAVATFAQRIDGAGNKLWTQEGIEPSFSPIQKLEKPDGLRVVADGTGGAVMVSSGLYEKTKIAAQRISGDGKHLWMDAPLVSDYHGDWPDPQSIPDGSGGALISLAPMGDEGPALVMRLDGTGKLLWKTTLSPGGDDTKSVALSKIVSDGRGGAIVVWRNGSTDGSYFTQSVNAKGQVQWKNNILLGRVYGNVPRVNGGEEPASVIADGSGGVIVAWRTFQPVRGKNWKVQAQVQDVYVQRVSATGELTWKTPRLVAGNIGKTGTISGTVSLASNGMGGAIVTWSDGRSGFDIAPMVPEGMLGPDPQERGYVYAQHVTASGEMAWQDNGIDISSRDSNSTGCLERTSRSAVVAGFAVNMREQPDVSSEILLRLNRGTDVTVVERKTPCETIAGRKGRWTRARVPSAANKEGWIFDSYIVCPQHADLY